MACDFNPGTGDGETRQVLELAIQLTTSTSSRFSRSLSFPSPAEKEQKLHFSLTQEHPFTSQLYDNYT